MRWIYKMMKKGLILLILILTIMISVFASTMPSESQIQECADTLGVPFDDLKSFVSNYHSGSDNTEPDFVFSGFSALCSFFEESRNNSYSFTKKYEGKLIECQGILVDSIGGFANHYFLLVFEGDFAKRYYNFYVYINPSEESKLSGITAGSRVTVRGILKSDYLMFRLNEAVIVQ